VYSLNTPAPPSGHYLATVRLGEKEVQPSEIEISSGLAPLTLVYKTNGGTVRGAVENCATGGVVLTPLDPAVQWRGFVRKKLCDSKNRYEITDVRPGEYYALAFSSAWLPELDDTDIAEGKEYSDIHFWARDSSYWSNKFDGEVLKQATRVTVRAGEVTLVDDLRAISQPAN